MAAAPADYRPAEPVAGKRSRGAGGLTLALEPTQDVLAATVPVRKEGAVVVGFALETEDDVRRAREKLVAKRLQLVVLNRTGEPGSGFEADANRVTLVSATDAVPLPLLPKAEVADRILDEIERLL
jgi:phosphopantothenoylcysteine decarboxylase/phosphopantothenate--cysteine ligase